MPLDSYFPDEETKLEQKNGIYYINAKKFRAYINDRINDKDDFYLLLDEVQLLDNFIGTLNSFLRHKNLDVYVTGSNSRFLSSDIATEFKGRGTIVHVLPLSFSEYMQGQTISPQEVWKEYIITGGIPLVAQMVGSDEKISYLKSLCEETYLKDIIAHNKIKKKTELADTFNIIASTIGSPVLKAAMKNLIRHLSIKTFMFSSISLSAAHGPVIPMRLPISTRLNLKLTTSVFTRSPSTTQMSQSPRSITVKLSRTATSFTTAISQKLKTSPMTRTGSSSSLKVARAQLRYVTI